MNQHATASAQPASHYEPVSPRQQLEATTQAVLAAHEHHLRRALGNVGWERRGILQRLTHTGDAAPSDSHRLTSVL